jgi:hypothetical protein
VEFLAPGDEEPEDEPDLEVAAQVRRLETARVIVGLSEGADVDAALRVVEEQRSAAVALLRRGSSAACESLVVDLSRLRKSLLEDGGGAAARLQEAGHAQLLQRHVTIDCAETAACRRSRKW